MSIEELHLLNSKCTLWNWHCSSGCRCDLTRWKRCSRAALLGKAFVDPTAAAASGLRAPSRCRRAGGLIAGGLRLRVAGGLL